MEPRVHSRMEVQMEATGPCFSICEYIAPQNCRVVPPLYASMEIAAGTGALPWALLSCMSKDKANDQ